MKLKFLCVLLLGFFISFKTYYRQQNNHKEEIRVVQKSEIVNPMLQINNKIVYTKQNNRSKME